MMKAKGNKEPPLIKPKGPDQKKHSRSKRNNRFKEYLIPPEELVEITQGAFLCGQNTTQCTEIFEKTVRMGVEFKLGSKQGDRVVSYRDQQKILDSLLEPMPIQGKPIDEVLAEVEDRIVNGSVNFSSPKFIAFPDCGNSIAGIAGHMLLGFLNQNLINSVHTSPTATFVEIAVINWLRRLVGFEVLEKPKSILDVGGIGVPGGVMANTVGILLARESKFPGTLERGIDFDPNKIKVYMPAGISHYSSKAAMGWIGIGTNNMVEVDTNKEFRIDQKDLLKKIETDVSRGCVPLALVAYCGDSRTLTIDDMEGLSQISRRYGMWFHVDACHGLSLCFTKKMRRIVDGISQADSITVDPHKVLFSPYPLSYVLLKDPSRFQLIAGISDLITKEDYSFGQITPFLGTRAFNSLKLWIIMKNLGVEGIGRLIEHRHGMALYFAAKVEGAQDFYVMNEVNVNNVIYLYVPRELRDEMRGAGREDAIKKVNELNRAIQKRIFIEGNFYVHGFQLNDFKNVLGCGSGSAFQMQRVSIGNPLTTTEIIDEFVDYLELICKEEYERGK